MKVFLSSTSLLSSYGGPAHSVSRLADALAEQGVEVGLWAADGSALTTTLLDSNSRVTRLSGQLTSALDTFGKPDVIHDNGLWLRHNHELAVIAAKRGVPRVVSTRGMLEPWAMQHKRLKKTLAWLMYQRRDLAAASALHATNEREAANIDRFGLRIPVRTIPIGVDVPDIDRAKRWETEFRTALFLGRIYPVKGLPMLIEAWRRAKPSGWRLVIAGPDEAGHLAEVQRAVDKAGLGDQVSFTGQVQGETKRNLYLESDLFVLPTLSESFGVAIAEALSYAVPVLTTTAAPWAALEAHECGWSVSPTVDSFALGLAKATSLPRSTLMEMGANGREFVSSAFRWSAIAAEFESWLREVARPVKG